MSSSSGASSPRVRRLICVLQAIFPPAARTRRSAAKALSQLPGTPRIASWVAARPSTETVTPDTPASMIAATRSSLRFRPPVVIVQLMPALRIARMIRMKSLRR